MALDFPDSPSNGQVYNGFMWDDTPGLWRVRGSVENPAGISATTGSPTTATSGGYNYYAFTGDGSITISVAGIVDAVVIAGGGGGGSNGAVDQTGGGGGAGGVLGATNYYLLAGTYAITVGAGGAGTSNGKGVRGEDSILSGLVAMGGGNGGKQDTNTSGGSGGSPGSQNNDAFAARGFGLTNQGHACGATVQNSSSGGGGGAGGVGLDGSGTTGGDGGPGTSSYSDWGIALSLGELDGGLRYFGGGGGGAGAGSASVGGVGGGGDSDTGAAGTAGSGTANTGGGGGGAEGGTSGDGGSGLVMIRVAV